MTKETNSNIINYFNGNNLLIDTPIGKEYGGISAWQGIRSLGSNIYLICGTTNPTPNTGNGLIYIGDINCQDGNIHYLNVPNSLGTSVYGPNYDNNTGIYTFVGSFLDYNQKTNGFIYQGNLNDLKNESNFIYPSINQYFNITFFHSYSNRLFVGNSGNNNLVNDTVSYIYDINNLSKIKTLIKYPNSLTTTTYGIWYNGKNNYTLVGGYSTQPVSINNIYTNNGIIPIGNAFIVDYNYETNTFNNWTSINLGDTLLTHFQGISQNQNGTYSINADVLDLQVSILPIGYFLIIDRDINDNFVYNLSNAVKISYNEDGVSSSNSVADNKVVGLHIGNDNTKTSYQAEIINNIFISKSNTVMNNVKMYEIIKFDNTFLENNYINYKNGIFTFLENGTYFISFNIYIENTKLPSVSLSVEYTNNNIKNNIIISQKGIDEIGTGTAHSLVLPCSFINKFTINDTIKIRNISEGSIDFISNYVKNATNGIISIYKIA
jgi:hypothetical protein